MDFLFEVKFKDGKIQTIKIRAKIAAEAMSQLKNMYDNIANVKLLN